MIRKAALLPVLTATLLASPAVAAGGVAAGAHATAAAAQATRAASSLVISSITPDAPRDRKTPIRLSGTFTNDTGVPLSGLTLRLRYSNSAFTSRAEMQAYSAGENLWRDRASESASLSIPAMAAGATQPWELEVTPEVIDLWRFGVYPLAVQVVNGAGQTVAMQRTFLPYAPADTKVARTRFSIVLPVLDQQPRRSTDRTFLNDDLRTAVTGDGRLADLLALARTSGTAKWVTWLVDPALLDDLTAMAEPYSVGLGRDREEHQAEPAAGQWVSGLREALTDAPVVATPYADPDVAALAHQGLDGVTATALTAAAESAKAALSRDVPTTLNWPAAGLLDDDALDELAVGGVKTVLLSDQNLPTNPPSAITPDAASTLVSVAGPVTAVVADAELSDLVSTDVAAPGAATVARQRFIAETAMITAENTATSRTVVAAPYRRWHPDPDFVASVLKSAAKLPWLTEVPISSIKPPKTRVPRSPLTYTEQERRDELGKSYLAAVKRTSRQAQLTADVTQQADDRHAFERPLLRLTSSAWRGKTDAARTAVDQVGDAVADHIGEVTITGAEQPRTLAGADGVVPISVHNALDQAVAIQVDVKSSNAKQLEIKEFDRSIVIGAQQNQTVQVPLTSHISGETRVSVQLRTETGKRYGPPVELIVRTTGYTGIALVIVGGALSVMLAAVVLRVVRRRTRRGARRQARSTVPAATPVEAPVEAAAEPPVEPRADEEHAGGPQQGRRA